MSLGCIMLMAVYSFEKHPFSVNKKVVVNQFNGTETNSLRNHLQYLSFFVFQRNQQGIQVGSFRRPCSYISNFCMELYLTLIIAKHCFRSFCFIFINGLSFRIDQFQLHSKSIRFTVIGSFIHSVIIDLRL
ncbi:hypothetical protein D3C86_1790160 [compost metagenome]